MWAQAAEVDYSGAVAENNEDSVTPSENKGAESKGRPTPKRKDAEKKNLRPLVPADRKEAKKKARDDMKRRRNEAYARQQEAMRTGDERFMPERDRGRPRRLARAVVDCRWNFSEWLMPVLIIFMVITIFVAPYQKQVATWALFATYGAMLFSAIEAFWVHSIFKKLATQRFPNDDIPKWTGLYMFSRMIMFRRWRQPKPQIERGATV